MAALLLTPDPHQVPPREATQVSLLNSELSTSWKMGKCHRLLRKLRHRVPVAEPVNCSCNHLVLCWERAYRLAGARFSNYPLITSGFTLFGNFCFPFPPWHLLPEWSVDKTYPVLLHKSSCSIPFLYPLFSGLKTFQVDLTEVGSAKLNQYILTIICWRMSTKRCVYQKWIIWEEGLQQCN